MKKNMKNGFTLVELLAVIVILAIILVIAVPQIMNTIKDTTKASFESSVKMVAAQVENQYTVAQTLNKEFGSTGSCMQDWAGLNSTDYDSCTYTIESDGTAKVTLVGKGKFNGLSVCDATRSSATATEDGCTPVVNAVSFEDDDWGTIVAAVKQAYDNGTEYPYNVGDEKPIDLGTTLGTHTIRVANKTKCSALETETLSKSACGFVLEFKDIIKNMEMRGTFINLGGWPATNVRTYLNDENDETSLYNLLPTVLSEKIINTYVVSGHGSNTTGGNIENENTGVLEGGNYWSNDKLYLLSTYEVYGNNPGYDVAATKQITRQLDYYADKEVTTSNYEDAKKAYQGSASYWWLRSADSNSTDSFYYVSSIGTNGRDYAYNSTGVSPAFRLAN